MEKEVYDKEIVQILCGKELSNDEKHKLMSSLNESMEFIKKVIEIKEGVQCLK
jgi:hypothetical protein